MSEYQWASRLKPDLLPAIEGAGKIYLVQKNYSRAIVSFRRLIELEPDNAIGYHNLGIALKARNRNQEAISAFDRALKLYRRKGETRKADKVGVLLEEINNSMTVPN